MWGLDAELHLQPDGWVGPGELPKQGRQNVEIEIVGCAEADEICSIAAEPMLGLLMQGQDAPRVGQKNLAPLGEPEPTRLAHDQGRTDLLLETFDVKADRRLGEVYLTRGFGEAAGVVDGDEGSEEDCVVKHRPLAVPSASPSRLAAPMSLAHHKDCTSSISSFGEDCTMSNECGGRRRTNTEE